MARRSKSKNESKIKTKRRFPDTKTDTSIFNDKKPKLNKKETIDPSCLPIKSILLKNKSSAEMTQLIKTLTKQDIENEFRYLQETFKNEKKIGDTLFLINLLIDTDKKEHVIKICLILLEKCQIDISIEVIKMLLRQKYYVPLSFKLISLIKTCVADKKSGKSKNKVGIKVDAEKKFDPETSFMTKELLALLFAHLNSISNSPSFVELVFFIIQELEKINFWNDPDFNDVIKRLKAHSKYVEEIRKNKGVGENEIQMMVEGPD